MIGRTAIVNGAEIIDEAAAQPAEFGQGQMPLRSLSSES